MKKILAFLMALVMLIPGTLCVGAAESATAPDVPAFGHTLDGVANVVTPATGAPKYADGKTSGATNLAGVSGRAFGLTIGATSGTQTASSIMDIYARNDKSDDAAVGAITDTVANLTRGTYRVSVWIRSNDTANLANTELTVELLPSTVINGNFKETTKPGDLGIGYVTLYENGSAVADTYYNANGKTWNKYEAEITVSSGFSKMCLWATTVGENATSATAYIDELSIEKVGEQPAPVLAGAQLSSGFYETDDGKQAVSIRFVGGVDSYENYEALGFRIAYRYQSGTVTQEYTYRDVTTDCVYTSVLAGDVDSVVRSINCGVKYFYAVTVTDILKKDSGKYEFIVTPVAIEKDTHKELVLESCRYVVKASDGTFMNNEFACVDTNVLPSEFDGLFE